MATPDREKEIRERPLTKEEARIAAWNENHAVGYSEAWGERSWSRNANRHDAYAIGFADGAEYQRTNDETDAQALLAEIERLKDPSTILREAAAVVQNTYGRFSFTDMDGNMARWDGAMLARALTGEADRLDSTGEGKDA